MKYAPTVSTTAVMAGVSIAAAENRAVATLDFTGAFLYADMPTEQHTATLVRLGQFLTRILVKLDPSYEKFVQPDGTCVVILQKALYGTIIAAAAWYKKISSDLIDLGYKVSSYDNCVFYKQILGKQTLIFLHVDDMYFAAAGGEAAIDIAIDEIKSRCDEVTVHRGKKLTYLGIDFDFSTSGQASLSMCDYVDNTVKMFEEKHGTVTVCSVPANDFIFKTESDNKGLINKRKKIVQTSNQDNKLNEEMTIEYHSHIMRIQYLTKHVRYDTVFPVSILNKRIKNLQKRIGMI